MLAQQDWSHVEWKHDDEKRLQLALGLSVVFHALLLLAWKLPPPVWRAADQAVLTVVLRVALPRASSPPAAVEKSPAITMLVQKEPAPRVSSVPPAESVVQPVGVAVAETPGPESKASSRLVWPSSRGRAGRSSRPPSPVGVTVTLVVARRWAGANGFSRTGCPHLTDERLRRIEAAISPTRAMPRGRQSTELFDVRGF